MKQNVFGIWISDSDNLGFLQVLSIKSFLVHGHNYTLYTYKNFKNVPTGCVIKDANQFIPESKVSKDLTINIQHFADILKYTIVYETGELYVDLDIICLSDTIPSDDYYFISEYTDNRSICCGCFKAPAKSEFLKEMLDYIHNPLVIHDFETKKLKAGKQYVQKQLMNKYENDHDIKIWETLEWGSMMSVSKHIIEKLCLTDKIHPRNELFLFDCFHAQNFIDPNIHLSDIDIKNMWGLHIYNGMQAIYNATNLD